MARADQNSFKQKKIDNEKTSAPKAVDRGAAQLKLPLSFSFCRTDGKASGCFFKLK